MHYFFIRQDVGVERAGVFSVYLELTRVGGMVSGCSYEIRCEGFG